MAAKTQIVHVAVDKATERQLKEVAKRDDLPVSAVVRRAVTLYLAAQNSEGQAA
jgi:hypothetical protein